MGDPERAHVNGTAPTAARSGGMDLPTPCCLISNDKSGSNDEAAIAALQERCAAAGLAIDWHVSFPHEDLPSPAALDAVGIALVVIFTGDGTLNAALDRLAGWSGQVLVLPGGTQNLLAKRLHGDVDAAMLLAAFGAGAAWTTRPGVIRCLAGNAYAELQAGPGTAWHTVREAMRDGTVLEMAQESIAAIGETLAAPGITARDPALGDAQGYPLLVLTARDDGIAVSAYHARQAGDYVAQAAALLNKNFRDGPHENLGLVPRVTLASADGQPFGLLLDGEPADPGPSCTFELAACAVDLLATRADG
jgi:Diacylglycerol kinase catalytic domain